MTDSFAVTLQLRYKHGLLGYAIYMRLLERIKTSSGKRISFDKNAIRWDLRENISDKVLESVVKDFDLFVVKDNYIYLKDSSEIEQEEKRKRISEVRREAGKKSAEARARKKELEKQSTQAPVCAHASSDSNKLLANKTAEFAIENPQTDAINADEVPVANENLNKLKDYWNSKVNSKRTVRWLCSPADLWYEYIKTASQYSYEEIKEAIDEALKQQYGWSFFQVVKLKNVSNLLSQASKRTDTQTQATSFEQKELLDYAKRSGKAW